MPRLLFGYPLLTGTGLVAVFMLHNPTLAMDPGVTVRLVLDYVPSGRPWPLADKRKELYLLDRRHYLRRVRGTYQVIREARGAER